MKLTRDQAGCQRSTWFYTLQQNNYSLYPGETDQGSGWVPEEHMVPYLATEFNVEEHATQILQQGNISEEVSIC